MPTFTDVPFQLTSFALSLLLVFRTDASYSRWCAALGAWESLRSASKQLIRSAFCWMSENEADARARLVRWTLAYSRWVTEQAHRGGDGGVMGLLLPRPTHGS